MKPLNVFSAFDGAGIGLLALKRAGIPVAAYYASEVDKYAMQISKKNHPEIIHMGDIKQCWARTFPKIDLPDGDYTIRKLTTTECERLQTWPDGYTEGVSNTQRYKMIGNGWTADVVAHIFGFIPKEEAREANH